MRKRRSLPPALRLPGLAAFAHPVERPERADTLAVNPYSELQSSIRYAKRIQDAMMLKEKHLHRLFPASFLLLKPRDVVSGDFYWITKIGNRIIVAVADCTGHGIPGAFMSVLGISLLNQIVIEEHNTSPSSILQRLDHKVKKAFSYSVDPNEAGSHDGMDIALCCIDYDSLEITFSGAFRPMYFIGRNGSAIVKGSRYPIGGLNLEAKRDYAEHSIPFSKGDNIYMFSDGYADQFGYSTDRKFMAGKFRNLLQKIHNETMREQRRRLSLVFDDWKGNEEQTDDMLVIGITL